MQDLIVAIIATTLSIALTFGTAAVANQIKRSKERKMTVLMVLSSIE